jgi:hypothetical protein
MADGMPAGSIIGVLPAHEGLRVAVLAPAGADVSGIPSPGTAVGWVLVADPRLAGGARVDPVFLADGRTWTPDQYRATYGQALDIRIGRG